MDQISAGGAVERAVRAHVERLCAGTSYTAAQNAYAATAVRLGGLLDEELVSTRAASLSRSLTEVLTALAAEAGTRDAWDAELAQLSAPLRDSPAA